MGMQTDVKATHLTADGVISANPARLKAISYRGNGTDGNVSIKNGGAYMQGRSGLLQGVFRTAQVRREQAAAEQAALEVLAFLGMEDAAQLMPAELPYGRQKQVEFARALMQKARLIMLDEPMAGMSSAEKAAMTALIQRVRAQYGITFLIVEHDIPVIMDISDKIVVLDFGRKIAEGPPLAVQNNPEVIAAYLGTGH